MMNNKKGLFISIEGVDGSGKSTITSMVLELLRFMTPNRIIHTREPGGTPLAEKLREIIIHDEMDPYPELLLLFAGRHDHYHKLIKPELDYGSIVVTERFTDSSIVFQGYGKDMTEQVKLLDTHVMQNIRPDKTYIVDVPYEVAKSRMTGRSKDRFENMPDSYHESVRNNYRVIRDAEPNRCVIVDNTSDINVAVNYIVGDILSILNSKEV